MTGSDKMSAAELRASLGLAGIFGLRMLGLFIILPVFALYAERLPGGQSHTLIGIALGAYGLTQALLQLPLGWLSDRWGRKRTIYLGLAVFALGSFIAAGAQDVYLVIVGRVVQGAGAISAVVIALVADLTRDTQRTKAMAIVGMTIGATFGLSMVAGPALAALIGIPGIFALTGGLALLALGVVRWIVPDPQAPVAVPAAVERASLLGLLRDPDLARLNVGIFVLHAVLMALWVVVPFGLRSAGLPAASHWQVYLPVMAGSVILMVPPMLLSERSGRQKGAFLAAIAVLLAAQALLAAAPQTLLAIAGALLLFFAAFNLLEASLPSMISKVAPAGSRGAATGLYSSVQFLGTFAGAAAGGAVSEHLGRGAVFGLCILITLVWLIAALGMRAPARIAQLRVGET